MTARRKQIWAYLHDELTPKKRNHFEQALQRDPALHDALAACRIAHGEIESILPFIDAEETEPDEQLEAKLLAEWEAEHPEHAETPAQAPRRKILSFSLPLAAAAAAAAILLSLSLPSKPVQWQRTAYGNPPQLRGQSEVQPQYTRAELKQSARELQKSINSQLSGDYVSWKLKIHMQEWVEGTLSIGISGHPRGKPALSREWNKTFQSLSAFREHIPAFGKQVAADLAERDNP